MNTSLQPFYSFLWLLFLSTPLAGLAQPADMRRMEKQQNTLMRDNERRMHQMWAINDAVRASASRSAYSAYRQINLTHGTPEALESADYIAPDFATRREKLSSMAVLPPVVINLLYHEKGYYVAPLLTEDVKRVAIDEAMTEMVKSFQEGVAKNKKPLTVAEFATTTQRLTRLGYKTNQLPDTSLKALFDCLGTDLIIIPRISFFAVGTAHVKDVMKRGARPNRSIQLDEVDGSQGVYASLEYFAYDRASVPDSGQATPIWRSVAHTNPLIYIPPGSIVLGPVRVSENKLKSAPKGIIRYADKFFPFDDAVRAKIKRRRGY